MFADVSYLGRVEFVVVVNLVVGCFFFFKQKTAYELRISDWSSDVCSSDIGRSCGAFRIAQRQRRIIFLAQQRLAAIEQGEGGDLVPRLAFAGEGQIGGEFGGRGDRHRLHDTARCVEFEGIGSDRNPPFVVEIGSSSVGERV